MKPLHLRGIFLSVTALVLLGLTSLGHPAATPVDADNGYPRLAFAAVPTLEDPAPGTQLTGLGAILRWTNPAGATQYQLQVIPALLDGPGINLILPVATSFEVPAPTLGAGPYVMLPGMGYTWRLRSTDKDVFAPEDDPSWGPWSEERSFRTPAPSSAGLQAVSPADGAQAAASPTFALQWSHPDKALFYWELQVSGEASFNTDPATATSFVWGNLVHGGVPTPVNSWRPPEVVPGQKYFWRLRPRVQGDGTPVEWGPTWSFTASSQPAPTATPTMTPMPIPATPTPTPASSPSATPAPAPPPPTGTPVPYKLAFVSSRDGNLEVYVMNSDGSGLKNLSNNTAPDSRPAWSPDGTKIAFARLPGGPATAGTPGLYTVNADGSNLRLLVSDDRFVPASSSARPVDEPVWSPDGAKIAFVVFDSGTGSYWLDTVKVDGTSLVQVATEGGPISRVSWALNSAQLLYDAKLSAVDTEVFQVAILNGAKTNLSSNAAAADFSASYAPNGTKIVFVSNRDGNQEIYVMLNNGSEKTNLTLNEANDFSPVWSPNSEKILFVSRRTKNNDIFVMNADGTGVTQLTSDLEDDEDPLWSPDGSLIAFVSTRTGNREIFVMNADGSNQQNLTKNSGSDYLQRWSKK